jgi:hypothetical protein
MCASFIQKAVTFVTRVDSTLNIVTAGSSETSVHIHRTLRRHIPVNRNMNHNFTLSTYYSIWTIQILYLYIVYVMILVNRSVLSCKWLWTCRKTNYEMKSSHNRNFLHHVTWQTTSCVRCTPSDLYIQIFIVTLCKLRSRETQRF